MGEIVCGSRKGKADTPICCLRVSRLQIMGTRALLPSKQVRHAQKPGLRQDSRARDVSLQDTQ